MYQTKKSTAAIAVAVTLSAFMLVQCGGKKKGTIGPKGKQLMGKSWKKDTEASRTANLTKAGKASGIKNLKDIKLKGDVKKGMDYLSAKSVYFGRDKKRGTLVVIVTTGKGFLKSKVTWYTRWNADQTELTFVGWGKRKGKDVTYKIDKLTANELQLTNTKSNVTEVYKR